MISRRVQLLLLAVVGTLAVGVGLTGCTGKDAVDQSTGDYRFHQANKLGTLIDVAKRKHAGSFSGPLLTGTGELALAQLAGKVVVVNFWASWCAPCKVETPQLDAVYRENKAKGVEIVGIDTKDLRSQAQPFVKDNDISYPMVFDEQAEAAVALGHLPAQALPFSVIIDKQQRVAAVYVGNVTPKDLQPVLNSLVAES